MNDNDKATAERDQLRAEVERLRDALDDERSQHRKDVKTLTEGQNLTDRMRREAIADGERRMREGDEALAKLRAEVEREKSHADKMKADGERAVMEERNQTAKTTAERDRLAGLLSESRRRLQGFYRNPPAMPIARDLLNRIDAALKEIGGVK